MEIVWKKEIEDKEFIGYNNMCKPIVYEDKLYYSFCSIDKENRDFNGYYGSKITVIVVDLNDETSIVKQISFKYQGNRENRVLLQNHWNYIIKNNKIFLYVGFLLEISKPTITIEDINYKLERLHIKSDYEFHDKILKYNQRSTIECFEKEGKQFIWKVKLRGYLYTDIMLKNDCLIFGTAGKGGALYCIQLCNGKILTEYVNGDSSNIEWYNETILLRDSKGNIIHIDPFKNEILKKLELKDKLFYAPILVDKAYFYTTVHNKKLKQARIICGKIM